MWDATGYIEGSEWQEKSWSSERRGARTQQEHKNTPVKKKAYVMKARTFGKPKIGRMDGSEEESSIRRKSSKEGRR